jgi:hypothetical protein
MGKEFIDAPWAKDAVKVIDKAIMEHNKQYPEGRMLVAWGDYPGIPEDAKEDMQCGLLSFDGIDFQVQVRRPSENQPLRARFGQILPRTILLRITPREIFNVLFGMSFNCQMSLFRRNDTEKIDIFAVDTYLYIHQLSGDVLGHALGELAESVESIHEQLVSDAGPDWWNGDDNDYDDDDEG